MTVTPIDYNRDATALIFSVKHKQARCTIKGYFETEEAEVVTYNKSFTYELFVKASTMLFSNYDFVVKTPEGFKKIRTMKVGNYYNRLESC